MRNATAQEHKPRCECFFSFFEFSQLPQVFLLLVWYLIFDFHIIQFRLEKLLPVFELEGSTPVHPLQCLSGLFEVAMQQTYLFQTPGQIYSSLHVWQSAG